MCMEKRYRFLGMYKRYMEIALKGITCGIIALLIVAYFFENVIVKLSYIITAFSFEMLVGIIILTVCYKSKV